ncbi:zinc finger protein Xfin-like [Galleria mellonella]|uniref:Zinc finger protein Xfin-like n=1 Tax=Galleria mellonella TaxID=7137 RepID=A0ABM3MBK7_GALME|nr:zinc finger protein Xfin-like [Galleria mellonella]
MSEKGIRRSRKSKLVPRDCTEVEDENILQMEIIAKKLPKLLPKLDESSPQKFHSDDPLETIVRSEPRSFSINIEVEEFDENEIIIDAVSDETNDTNVQNENNDDIDTIKKEIILENKINEKLKKTLENNVSLDKLLDKSVHSLLKTNNNNDNQDLSDISMYKVFTLSPKDIEILSRNDTSVKSKKFNTYAVVSKSNKSSTKSRTNNVSQTPKSSTSSVTVDLINQPPSIDEEGLFREAMAVKDKTSNPADRKLAVELVNSWGRVLYTPNKECKQETLLQDALNKWRIWNCLSKFREVPLTYKCYVCKVAYWRLTPFREHIIKHKNIKLGFESIFQECHIKAYYVESHTIKNFPIDSNCWRCNKSFEEHPTLGDTYKEYNCRFCQERYYTCTTLTIHEGLCEYLNKKNDEDISNIELYKCTICSMVLCNETYLYNHSTLFHGVWSDLPISSATKTCTLCNERYVTYLMHVCPNKHSCISCPHCCRRFSSKLVLNVHLEMTESDYHCSICNLRLDKKCMEPLHLIEHSEEFMMVYRCIMCAENKVFLDTADLKEHKLTHHKQKFDSRRIYYDIMLVPKKGIQKIFKETSETKQGAEVENLKKEIKYSSSDNNTQALNKELEAVLKVDCKSIKKYVHKVYTKVSEYNDVVNTNDIDTNNDNKLKNKTLELNDSRIENFAKVKIKEEAVDTEENTCLESDDYLTNVFKVSDEIKMGGSIKIEVKQEPEDEEIYTDDIIILNNSDIAEDKGTVQELDAIGTKKNLYKCKHCSYQASYDTYKEHISKCTKNSKRSKVYNCSKCTKSFVSLKRYVMHLCEEHNVGELTCAVCNHRANNYTMLMTHFSYHIRRLMVKVKTLNQDKYCTANSDFQCKKCKDIVTADNLFVHWESHFKIRAPDKVQASDNAESSTSSGEPAQFLNGSLDAATRENLLTVLQMEVPNASNRIKIKTCPYCERTFERYYDSKRHIIEHLLLDAYAGIIDNKGLKCQICSDTFDKRDLYKQHMRDHASMPVYLCELCNKAFSDSSNFSKHKKVHNLSVYKCDICDKKFQMKISLSKHISDTHKDTKPNICQFCNKVFHTDSSLRKHIRQHDKTLLRYRCLACNEKFSSLKDKWDHMWQAHKQRTQAADCPICAEAFRKYIDVKKHIREKHGLDPSYVKVLNRFPSAKVEGSQPLREKIRMTKERISLLRYNNTVSK